MKTVVVVLAPMNGDTAVRLEYPVAAGQAPAVPAVVAAALASAARVEITISVEEAA